MDYPVLVNPGKPPLKNAHEEENKLDRFRRLKTPQKRRRGAQGGAAARQAAEGPAGVAVGAAGRVQRSQIDRSPAQDRIGAGAEANR